MQARQHLFVVELGMNGSNPVKDKIPVEFLGGVVQYQNADERLGQRTVQTVETTITRIRYNHGGFKQRNFGLYGLTDGKDFVTDMTSVGESVLVGESGVRPQEPLSSAHVLIVPDGRLYVEESLLMRGGQRQGSVEKSQAIRP